MATLGRVVQAQRVHQERQHAQEQLELATKLLAQKSAALQATLGSMSQGIFKLDADARISVYNQRVLELLNLPEDLMGTRPTLAELTRVQAERGDFGDGYGFVDGLGRDYIAQGAVSASPEVYWRRTRAGTTIEVRTKNLPEGGLVRTFADVTDYFGIQQELRESEARLRSLTELSSDWLWEQDAEFRFVRFDGDWRSSGITPEQSLGTTRWGMGALNMGEPEWEAHRKVLRAHEVFKDLELKRARPDGSFQWISVSGAPIFDARGKFCGYRGVGKDITDRKQVEGKVERLAFYDLLTGLPNRRLLVDRLQQALAASGRSGALGALLFIDLDNFKDLNDTLGHDMGDRLLEQVAKRLVGCVRESDTVARFGGDEFVVMLENLSSLAAEAAAHAERVAEKLLAAMNQPFELQAQNHYSTPSIGITLIGRQDQSIDELLKHADLAMYQAKAAGRNTLCFFDPDMQAAVSARSALEADLRQGLQRQELLLYYQAVVDEQGRLMGAEALVRWQHPQRGLVSPATFIPLAEQTGLILPLGQWVLQAACEQLVAWQGQSATEALSIAVNVSARQFRHPDFVAQVLEVLRQTGARPQRLKLELTESLLLQDVEDIIGKMNALKARGVGFSLDDFGTGYSSLSYLKRLPLDQLKIDQSFVRDVLSDPNDAAIAKTILALAQSLDLQVVAEGVETQGQLEFLKRNGCKAFQGYLFGRPAPVRVLEQTLVAAA